MSAAPGAMAAAQGLAPLDGLPPAGPALRETLSGLWADARDGGAASGTGLRLLLPGLAVDLVATLSLLAAGRSLAAASLAGFAAGVVVHLGLRARSAKTSGRLARAGAGMVVTVARALVVAALALGARGGAIGTAIALGLPQWMAVAFGIVAGGMVLGAGHTHYVQEHGRASGVGPMRWARAAVGMVAYVILLRILYMQPMPVMPQEAYYWNYAIHPDIGYLDHPPMVAWLIAAGEAIAGHGPVGVRLGAFACGLGVIVLAHQWARRLVDRGAALMAAALAAVLPYFFLASGGMMTPDAPLTLAWAAALLFFHRALVGGERIAWLGVGAAMGLGMLSKYTIALLGPSALAFCLVDRQARRWLLRPEPYLAALLAALVFAPVVYWNYLHDWASFRFQGKERYGSELRFSLHRLLGTVVAAVTPLPLLVLPLLSSPRWTDPENAAADPAQAGLRNRRFVACFVAVPLAVFAWNSLRHLPRLNWNGPIWLAVLPLLAWAIVHAPSLRLRWLGSVLRTCASPLLALLLVVYALATYYLAFGLPAVGYPPQAAPLLGWSAATTDLAAVSSEVQAATGSPPLVVGMDAYQVASQVSFHGRPPFLASTGTAAPPLEVTAIGELFGGEGLMFAYWHPPAQFRGRALLMVARERAALQRPSLATYFERIDPEVHGLPLAQVGTGGERRVIDQIYYRVGYGYRPDPQPPH